jgi:hypothetical protein
VGHESCFLRGMPYDPEKSAPLNSTAPSSSRLLEILWVANFLSPLAYATLALLVGSSDAAPMRMLPLLPYAFGAIVAIATMASHMLWRRWSPADLPVHRARARAADLPILRVRLMQVWALDSVAGVLGLILAFLGFPKDVWIWFMLAPAALLFLHHPSHLHLAESAA